MVKCYKTKNLDSYYLEMGATEGFLKGEIKTLVDKLRDKEEYIKKLEEENKRLKEAFEIADMCVNNTTDKNEKLKSDLAFKNTMLDNVKAEYESSQDVIKKLNERIRFLEQCLDNKEKVNKSLREENKRLSDFLECES